jgi:hypothetical protein
MVWAQGDVAGARGPTGFVTRTWEDGRYRTARASGAVPCGRGWATIPLVQSDAHDDIRLHRFSAMYAVCWPRQESDLGQIWAPCACTSDDGTEPLAQPETSKPLSTDATHLDPRRASSSHQGVRSATPLNVALAYCTLHLVRQLAQGGGTGARRHSVAAAAATRARSSDAHSAVCWGPSFLLEHDRRASAPTSMKPGAPFYEACVECSLGPWVA